MSARVILTGLMMQIAVVMGMAALASPTDVRALLAGIASIVAAFVAWSIWTGPR